MIQKIPVIGQKHGSGVRELQLKLLTLPNLTSFTDITGVAAMSVVAVAFASAVVTGDFGGIEEEFHVGEVVTALSVSLMVCGFGQVHVLQNPGLPY